MHDVVFFVLKCQQQLLAVRRFYVQVFHQPLLVVRHAFFFHDLFLRRQRVAVVLFVQFRRVFQINFEYPSGLGVFFFVQYFLLRRHHEFPFESAFGEGLAHCPAVQVVCVQINYVTVRFAFVVVRYHRVVCLCVSLAYHRGSSTNSAFYK